MSDRALAYVGIGLFVLKVLLSATDPSGNAKVPEAFVLISEIASVIYIIVVSMRLWKRGTKVEAIALPAITFAAMAVPFMQTANPSGVNIIASGLLLAAFLAYFYAIFLLFAFSRKLPVG